MEGATFENDMEWSFAGTFSRILTSPRRVEVQGGFKESKRVKSARVTALGGACQKSRRNRGAIGRSERAAPLLRTSPSFHSLNPVSRRDFNISYVQSNYDVQHVQLIMRSSDAVSPIGICMSAGAE